MVSFLAEVVKLADTQGLGPCARKGVRVQLPPSAPKPKAPAQKSERVLLVGAGNGSRTRMLSLSVLRRDKKRDTGIEPASPPWKGGVLPLYESRFLLRRIKKTHIITVI